MRRLLYLGGFELPDKNAAAQRVVSNARLLREIGWEVVFIGISKDINNAPRNVDGFSSFPIPYPKNVIQWLRQITTYVSSDKILDCKPDYIVLYNFPAIASLKILHLCHKNGIKVIHDLTEWEQSDGYSPRNIIKRLDTALRMRYCMKKMDGVIAISRFLYNIYKDSVKTILVPPTVDLSSPKWNRERQLTALKPGDKIKIIFAGSAGPLKDRLDLVIDALHGFENIVLNIVGTTQQQFEQRFGYSPILNDNIKFMGLKNHLEAIKMVADSDFQVIIRTESLKTRAGFPTKYVESMSCCVPVIATKTSNIEDYLKNGVNGFIVEESQPLRKVFDIISNLQSDDIKKMKQNCKNFEGFDYHSYLLEFSKIFKA